MKKILTVVYHLFVLFIPIAIIWYNVDAYLATGVDSLIEYLKDYAMKLALEENEATLDFKTAAIKVGLLIVMFKYVKKFIFDRKLGLSLKERKGDWIITIWAVAIRVGVWLWIIKTATFLKVNTDAWLESFNIIIALVIIGVVAKLWNTYLYYMENIGVKK